jgi:hypothetical protein
MALSRRIVPKAFRKLQVWKTLSKNQGMRPHRPRRRVPNHHPRPGVVSGQHAATAKDLFHFRFGIAFFAKVSHCDQVAPGRLSTDVTRGAILLSDNLFICDSCDKHGVPDLICSSGKHTEEHHLIRCLAPEKAKEATSSTEQRLMSLEKRFDNMQTRFDSLDSRFGNIEQLLHRLANKIESL